MHVYCISLNLNDHILVVWFSYKLNIKGKEQVVYDMNAVTVNRDSLFNKDTW